MASAGRLAAGSALDAADGGAADDAGRVSHRAVRVAAAADGATSLHDDVYALGVLWYQLLVGDLNSPAPSGLWTEELAEKGLSAALIQVLGACVEPKNL